ncbi:ATP synthase mitochondrial F1 complex assembly factor 1 isoform X2 [Anabrus simplex]
MELLLRRWHSFRQMFRFNIVRSITASPADDVGDDLRSNPYFEKYSEKIRSFQKENPEEFKSRLEGSKTIKSEDKCRLGTQQFSSLLNPKENPHGRSLRETNLKALDNIMKLDLVEDKTTEEIKQIWESYHKQKDGISATIPCDLYDMMQKNGKKYPLFVFPLPRDQGYEFFLCQVVDHTANFTPLINYQAHRENAPVCLTMVHYVELKEKGIVLMCGEFNKDVLDARGAQCLANQYQLYYGRENKKRLHMLETLNYSPNEFRHMDLIAELECMSF